MKKLLLVLLALPLLFSCGGSLDKERSSEMSDEIPVDGGNQTAEDYFNKSKDYVENEQYQLAIDNLTAALKINPDFALAYYNRGNAYYDLENYTAAIADFTSAIKIDPDAADAYRNRGIAKENAGQSYCSDYKRACDLGDEECCEWYNDQCK
jgi:tetratricopeptide (TPR) repeat protein